MEPTPKIEISPYCCHLASKKLTFRTLPPREESDVLDASCHCWCAKTQEVVGPDGDITDVEDCVKGRSCFQAYGS